MFSPEYVNIFGVPFTFLPHEEADGPPPPPPPPKTRIEPVPEKRQFEISWPNILRVDYIYRPVLSLELAAVEPLPLDASNSVTVAQMAAILAGKPDLTRWSEIDLTELAHKFRLQKITFESCSRCVRSDASELEGQSRGAAGSVSATSGKVYCVRSNLDTTGLV